MAAYYFGCLGRVGHGFHEPGGRAVRTANLIPWGDADVDGGGALRPPENRHAPYGKTQPEGKAVIEHRDGWTAIAFWDRTVDRRGNSKSVFLFDAELDFDQALAAARETFPGIFARYNFTVEPA